MKGCRRDNSNTAKPRCMFEQCTRQLTEELYCKEAESGEAYGSFAGLPLQHENPRLEHRP